MDTIQFKKYYGTFIAVRNNKAIKGWNNKSSLITFMKKNHRNTSYYRLYQITSGTTYIYTRIKNLDELTDVKPNQAEFNAEANYT